MRCCNFESEVRKLHESEYVPQPITETKREYETKSSLMSKTEKEFYYAIKKVLPEQFILQPQVNLASIIRKTTAERYQNELFRNIDFCILDSNFKPVALIEINDSTHITEKGRQARDYKVKEICQSANLPLIIFWTSYGINPAYIEKKIKEIIP